MSSLEIQQSAKVIIKALDYYALTIEQDKKNFEEKLVHINEEFKKAVEDGDLRENAAYEQAQRDITELTADINSAESQLGAIERCKEGAKSYRSTGIITNYSTVRLKRVKKDEGKVLENVEDEYFYTLFPYGITQPTTGILSSTESVVGRQLMGKSVGDEIKFRDGTTGAVATYKITEVE